MIALSKVGRRILGIGLLIVLWESNSEWGFYRLIAPTLPPSVFPHISAIAGGLLDVLLTKSYWGALLISTSRVITSFFLAATAGILLGLAGARIEFIDDLFFYPFEFFRQMPAVAIVPMAIILFGIGSSMKMAVAIFGCAFPIYVATRRGLAGVDRELIYTAQSYEWSGSRLLFGVMLPAALPSILAGLRIALSISLILVVMGEMLIGGEGLGYRLVERERAFEYASLYSETVLLGVLGVALSSGLDILIRRLNFWSYTTEWSESS